MRLSATKGDDSKYVHIIKHNRVGSIHVGREIEITIDDVKERVLTELRRLFPGCGVIYVERKPEADIFSGARPKTHGIDRAFVVDWSVSVSVSDVI